MMRKMLMLTIVGASILITAVALLFILKEKPPVFKIEEFVFASSISEEYSYTLQPENTYILGDNVFIYFKVSGMTQKKIRGKYNIQLTEDLELYDPKGKAVPGTSKKGIVKAAYENLDEKFPFVPIKNVLALPAELHEPGTYTVKATFTDEFSDEMISQTKNLKLLDSLNIENMRMVSFTDEEFGYIERPDVTYRPEERASLFFAVVGYATRLTDEGRQVTLTEYGVIKDKQGNQVFEFDFKFDDVIDTEKIPIRFRNVMDAFKFPVGDYVMEATIIGELSGKKITRSVPFYVR